MNDLPRFAITGARGRLSHDQERIIAEAIDALPVRCVVVTGACLGVDSFAAREAKLSERWVHTVVPANRTLVDPEWREWCDTFEEMPEGTTYEDRNVELVKAGADGLRGFPRAPEHFEESRRSGTWQTIRMGYYKLWGGNLPRRLAGRLGTVGRPGYTVYIMILGPEPVR